MIEHLLLSLLVCLYNRVRLQTMLITKMAAWPRLSSRDHS